MRFLLSIFLVVLLASTSVAQRYVHVGQSAHSEMFSEHTEYLVDSGGLITIKDLTDSQSELR